MHFPRIALALLLLAASLPAAVATTHGETEGVSEACVRVRTRQGAEEPAPIAATSGTTVTVGVEGAGNRHVVIVTPDKCVPHVGDLAHAPQAPQGMSVAVPHLAVLP